MKIKKPTLLVSKEKVIQNIETMVRKANASNAVLRPHFKTHQSAEIANWFREAGVSCATVSSVDMARYFADAGWQDITIAFPYNPLECEEITDLARRVNLNVIVVSKAALDHLNEHVEAALGYFIKMDVGTHRTGVNAANEKEIQLLARSKNPKHMLKGLLAHAGHTYKVMDQQSAQAIYDESLKIFESASRLIGRNDLIWSYGDTPSCSLLSDFSAVDELRPGNFVFYDITQHHYQSCSLEEIAVCMACPVVAIHPERNQLVLYGGGVHFSKDVLQTQDERLFGYVVKLTENGWDSKPIAKVTALSQEHGIVTANSELIASVKIGDVLGVLPVHSCMTADLQGYYVSLEAERISKFNKAST